MSENKGNPLKDYVDPSDWENGRPPADPRIWKRELDVLGGLMTQAEFDVWLADYRDGKVSQ